MAGIVGIIVYICIDLFNNSEQNSDSNDTEYTKGTNDIILDGKLILVKLRQPLKQPFPNDVILDGKLILVKLLQP